MSISDDAPNLVVSGETTLTETLRMISPGPSGGGQRKKTPGNQGPASRPGSKKTATRKLKATASTPAFVRTSFVKEDGDDLLNIAGIFQSIFPDLSENSLGEKRKILLKQAETYDQLKKVDKKKPKKAAKDSAITQNIIENDVETDEEWRREMLEYLRNATKEYEEHEQNLSRAEQYITEARGRAAASEKRNRPNKLTPIQDSVLPNYFDENAFAGAHLPSSILLPSQFYPPEPEQDETKIVKKTPKYLEGTQNSKANAKSRRNLPNVGDSYEYESQLSSDYRPSPVKRSQRPKAEKTKERPVVPMTEPSVTCRGLSRNDEEEHRRLANQVKKMQQEQFDFLKNPRSEAPVRDDLFVSDPPEIYFRQWEVGMVLETTVEVRNQDKVTRTCTVLPPEHPAFHLGLGRYPSKDGRIGPGLSVSYRVQFMPETLSDENTTLEVRHQAGSFKIPIRAIRDKPVLEFPQPIDTGYCLVNGSLEQSIMVKNKGGVGRFCLVKKSDWPSANYRQSLQANYHTLGPFTITPVMWLDELATGKSKELRVLFAPKAPGPYEETLLLTCDNCQTKEITIKGVAEEVNVKVFVESHERKIGELFDPFSTDRIRFQDINPRSSSTVTFEIANDCNLPLSFGLALKQPELVAYTDENTHRTHRIEDNTSPFFANIPTGSIAPHGRLQIELTFAPDEIGSFHSVFEVVVLDIPGYNRYLAAEVEVVGKCTPIVGSILPPMMDIAGEVPAGLRLKRQFQMINMSLGDLSFQWEVNPNGPCSVEPSFGTIPGRQMAPLQLCVEAETPGPMVEKLICHVENGDPIELDVKAVIKPPLIRVDQANLPFGIVEVGKKQTTTFTIDNRNPLAAPWSITVNHPDVRTSLTSGTLGPLEEIEIQAVWAPSAEYSLEGSGLTVVSANSISLDFYGDSLKPVVNFTIQKLDIGEIYVGVAERFTIELENVSLVPAQFQLIPANFLPSVPEGVEFLFSEASGELASKEKIKIEVEIKGSKAIIFKDFILACEIFNSNNPTFIEIAGRVSALAVQTWTSCSSDQLNLRFPIGKLSAQKIFVKNLTAITSSFKVEPKLLKGQHPKIRLKTSEFDFIPAEEKKKYQLLRAGSATLASETSLTYREFGKEMHKGSKLGASIIAYPDSCELGPFETKEVDIIASGNSWGTYKDSIVVNIGDLDPVEIAITATIDEVPITVPSPIVRLGKMPLGADSVKRTTPITNKANHSVSVRLYVLSEFDFAEFKSSGIIPGELVEGQEEQFENDPCPWPVKRQSVNFTVPEMLHFKPKQSLTLPIEFVQKENQQPGEISAYVVGILSLPLKARSDGDTFYRKTGTFGPAFELNLRASLDWASFQIEQITAPDFIENAADIISGNYEKEKQFSVFNTSGMTASIHLVIEKPFLLNGDQSETTISLKPNTREVLTVNLAIPDQVIYQQKPNEHFSFDEETHTMAATGELRTVGLFKNELIPCRAMISYPIVKVNKTEFDFGTCFLGDIFKLDICLDNLSSCATPFEFIPLEKGNFTVTPSSGTLDAGRVLTAEISFQADCEIGYNGLFEVHFSNKVVKFSCRGAGTLDSAYCNQFS